MWSRKYCNNYVVSEKHIAICVNFVNEYVIGIIQLPAHRRIIKCMIDSTDMLATH